MTTPTTDTALMITVVAGCPAAPAADGFFKLKTAAPAEAYLLLRQQGVLQDGDFTGVSVEKSATYRSESVWIEDKPREWVSAGRDMCDNWVDAHYEEAEGHYEEQKVFDGLASSYRITASKRADIRQEDGWLYMAEETFDAKALKARYEEALKKEPVKDILGKLVGKAGAASLSGAFNAVAELKPLSVEDSLDDGKVRKLQKAHAAALAGIRQAVQDSGLLDILPKDKVQALVRRAAGVDISFA